MDYDDTEFQSQNFQLVEEDSSKFPSGVRSFALPKLDLDEHFEVHLGFDSLVETESLRGMQGQVNNWIEEFSSGSSPLVFTSSAAESCSISRHNNVWSEVTSSESVEMLLKSVGEEEMINGGAIVKMVGTHDQTVGIDPKNSYLRNEDIGDIDPTHLPDKCLKSFSSMSDNLVGIHSEVDDLSRTSEGENFCMDLDVGSFGERLTSDRESHAEGCDAGSKKIASLGDTPDKGVQVGADDPVMDQKENLGNASYDDHICVAEVHKETPLHDMCAQDDMSTVSMDNIVIGEEKFKNEVVSKQVMEKHSGITVAGKDAPLDDVPLKIELGDANVKIEHSKDHLGDTALCNGKNSCLKANMDPTVLLRNECCEPIFSCNPHGLLEGNKSSETGDKTATRTEYRTYLAAECCQSSAEIGNEKSMNHTRRMFGGGDVKHDVPNDVSKSGFHSKSILSVESTKQFDGYMEDGKINTFAEVIEENKSPECLKVENNSGHGGNTTAEAVMLQSLNARTHEAEEPKLKDGDSLTVNSSDCDLVKLASADVEKCAEGGTSEKEVTVDPPQSAILEKSLSPDSGNHADADIFTFAHDRPVEIFDVQKLVAEPVSNGVTQGKSSSPEHTRPSSIHPSSCTSDSDASIPADKVKIFPSTIQNTPVLNIGDYLPATNTDYIESEEKEPRSSLPAYSDEKIMSSSRNLSSSLVNSNAEAQPVNKSVSEPVVMDCLLEKEMMHGVSSSNPTLPRKATSDGQPLFEDANAMAVVLEPKQKASSVSLFDVIQLNEGHVARTTFSQGDGKEQILLSSSPVNDSGDTGHLREPAATGCIGNPKDRMEQQTGNKSLSDQTGSSEDDQPWISSSTAEFADKVKPLPCNLKESTASDDGRSFAREVGSLAAVSEKSTPKHEKPVPSMQSFDLPQGRQFETEEVEGHCSGTKTSEQDKIRPASGCCSEINTTYGGKHTEERSSLKRTAEKDHNKCGARFSNVATTTKDVRSEIMRQYSEKSDMSLSCLPAAQTSGLPDLNSSTSAAVLLHQPFTDIQQVQLRAQIFVYGSLIQGTPPEEACMLSAFGETDGGRSLWEGEWRAAIERFQNLKAPYNACLTPLHSSSGVKVPEQVASVNSLQNNASNSHICLRGMKVESSTAFTSASCPTPLWSISTHDSSRINMLSGVHLDSNQAITPLSSHQASQRRKYTGNFAPLFSLSTHSGPVVIPSQSSRSDAAPQYSAAPVAVSLQAAPAGDSFISHASDVQHGGISALLHSPGSSSVSMAPVVQNEAYRNTGSTRSNKKPLSSQKPRKRKTATVAQELESIPPVSQSQTEPASVNTNEKIIYSAVQFSVINTPTTGGSTGPATTSHFISPSHSLSIHSGGNTDQKFLFSEEACNKIEQAKLQAEDAAALASSAVRHKDSIWSELASYKNSGLGTELQEKLASAAAAAAAAASVAKAAAAAAKIASDAALQAKMMADEALDLLKAGNTSKNSGTDLNLGKSLPRLTPVMILEGKDKFQESSSVISIAREASRKRMEAASAATKRAENLYAIVKAAELAAEAVSQAGLLVAMGDPLPLTVCELAEAGPDNFLKVHISTAEKTVKEDSQIVVEQLGIDGSGSGDTTTKEDNNGPSSHCETCEISTGHEKSCHKELPVESEKAYSDLGGLGNASSSDLIIRNGKALSSVDVIENGIKKDSLVEVVPDEDGLRGVWFSAWVLDVRGGKAYICYRDLRDEGSGPLKEWISLEDNGDKAPRIRIAHPMSAMESGGTRKRCRETIGNFVWAVGDHVDAFIRDGWWEGIITQKYKEDETKLTVHFPAGGDTSIVRSWNLRPSLIWKDGQWTQWSRPRDSTCQLDEGDTPNEKRPKLSRSESCVATEVDRRENGKLSLNLLTEASGRPEQSRPLVLSAKDRALFAGRNSKGENSSAALRITRTGLWKEGSGVVFGVPRPGKRRKFIEVSKHYIADKTKKASEVHDSIKLAEYLMPQASCLSRNTSTVDPKRKRDLGSRPKLPRPLKSQTTQASSTAEKKNFCGTIGGLSGRGPSNPRPSSSSEDNPLENRNLPESSSSLQNAETSSQSIELPGQPVPNVPVQKSFSAVEADVGVNGNIIPGAEKSIRTKEGLEHIGKGMSAAISLPRRSNRRIQPTSRLLEGLQSSLIISKVPSGTRDKGAQALHRGGTSSRGKPRG